MPSITQRNVEQLSRWLQQNLYFHDRGLKKTERSLESGDLVLICLILNTAVLWMNIASLN